MKSTFIENLKSKLSLYNSVAPPVVIADNFFNLADIADIKEKVFLLRDNWQLLQVTNRSIPVRLLPAGMYSRGLDDYVINVTNNKKLMQKNFESYYNRIKSEIKKYFGMEVNYLNSLNYPGFHVFVCDTERGKHESYNFHKDHFPYLNKFVNLGKIYSIVIPISMPLQGGNLLYKDNNKDNIIFNYKVGSMIMWEGSLTHSIEPFVLDSNQNRITMQFHINVDTTNNKISVFW